MLVVVSYPPRARAPRHMPNAQRHPSADGEVVPLDVPSEDIDAVTLPQSDVVLLTKVR